MDGFNQRLMPNKNETGTEEKRYSFIAEEVRISEELALSYTVDLTK